MAAASARERSRLFLLASLLILTTSLSPVAAQVTRIHSLERSSPNRPRLSCRVTDLQNREMVVENAVFFLNGTDVRLNLSASEFTENGARGEIEFDMRQELEGEYTCGTSAESQSDNKKLIYAIPTADTSIPLYYVQPVHSSVVMMCGIRLGRLPSFYTADWIYDEFRIAEQDYGDRAKIKMEELQDFSLSLSPLALTDSATYYCDVNVGSDGQIQIIRSEDIVLLVYQDPVIHFLSTSQLRIIQPNDTDSLPLQFICNATGSPDLRIQWQHNGVDIASDDPKFTVDTMSSVAEGLTLAVSVLEAVNPELSHSGNISCSVSISYQQASGDIVTTLRVISRTLTVLDSSLEPRPYPTQDEDLIVRIDLPPGVTVPGVTQIRLKTTSTDSAQRDPVNFVVDDVFFEGSRFYAFVPASQIRFRQFWVQVALVVGMETGPFSPAEVTDVQLIDFDDSSTCDIPILEIVLILTSFVLLVILLICIVLTIVYHMRNRTKIRSKELHNAAEESHDHHVLKKHKLDDKKDQRRAWQVLLTTAKEKLEEEKRRTPPNEELIDEWEVYLKDIFKKLMGDGEAGPTIEPEGPGIREDGGFREDMEITGIEGPEEKINSLIQQINQVMAKKTAEAKL